MHVVFMCEYPVCVCVGLVNTPKVIYSELKYHLVYLFVKQENVVSIKDYLQVCVWCIFW